jgi:hypothetical protein
MQAGTPQPLRCQGVASAPDFLPAPQISRPAPTMHPRTWFVRPGAVGVPMR